MNEVKCSIIKIDCFLYDDNNPIYGDYYGFVFYVDWDKRVDMVNYIIELFSELDIPIIRINYHDIINLPKEKVFNEEMIHRYVMEELPKIEKELNKYYAKR